MKSICFLVLLVTVGCTSPAFTQAIVVSVAPPDASIAINSKIYSGREKLKVKESEGAVFALAPGFNTQGVLISDLKSQQSEFVFNLSKAVKPESGFTSRKIKISTFLKLGQKEGLPIHYSTLEKSIKLAGYKLIEKTSMFGNEKDMPEIEIGGEWKWGNRDKVGKHWRAEVIIHWSVYSTTDEQVVYETTTGGFSNSGMNNSDADDLFLAMQDAINGLLFDPKFQDYAIKKTEPANATLPESILLSKLRTKTYSNYGTMVKESIGSVVTIKTDFGIGSGFMISDNGYILTNHHVVNGAEKIEVVFDNGFSFDAKLVRLNEDKDVALLKISGSGFQPLALNGADALTTTGTEVIAIGTPENIKLGQTVTKGIISGKREIDEKVFLQTDVAINSGNSGGPLINTTTGEVIGIVAAKIKAKGVEGLGFAIPIAEVIKALNLKFE